MHGFGVRAGSIMVAAVLGLAACGGDNSSSTVATAATTTSTATTVASAAPSTASAALCSAREDLKASVQDLQNIDLAKGGTSGVQAALTKVKDDLGAVRAAASSDLQPQITAFDDALKGLETAVSDPSAAAIAAGVKDVVQTGTTLLTGLAKLDCP